MSNIEEFKKLYNFEFEEIKAKNYKEIEKKLKNNLIQKNLF